MKTQKASAWRARPAGNILAALAMTLCIAFTAQPVHAQKHSATLVFGQEAPPPTLDPYFTSSIAMRNVAMHIFEQLVTRGENNGVIPGAGRELARSARTASPTPSRSARA